MQGAAVVRAVVDAAACERELGLDEAGVEERHRRCQRAVRSGRAASLRRRSFDDPRGWWRGLRGEVVFLYSDLHHVEICIGNGLGVSAPQPGDNIRIVRVADSRADFYGATRLPERGRTAVDAPAVADAWPAGLPRRAAAAMRGRRSSYGPLARGWVRRT